MATVSTATSHEPSFAELLEQSYARDEVLEGEIVTGTVISVSKDHVLVDVGYKSEGMVPIHEFPNINGAVQIKAGDRIDVLVESRENDNGLIVLSKEKADKLKIWDEISAACERDEMVEGTIISRVKGGLSVDIGVKAFLPGSQVDLRPIRNLDKLSIAAIRIAPYRTIRRSVVKRRRSGSALSTALAPSTPQKLPGPPRITMISIVSV